MPHQCVRCGKMYGDGDKAILEGCSDCKGRLFFYIKKQHLEESQKFTQNLSEDEKKEIEKDVLDLVGVSKDEETPVVLDFESIRILKPGQYEIDLVHLFKGDPIIFKLEEGKYMIDVIETFNKFTKNNRIQISKRNQFLHIKEPSRNKENCFNFFQIVFLLSFIQFLYCLTACHN